MEQQESPTNLDEKNYIYRNKIRSQKILSDLITIQTDDYLSVIKKFGIPTSFEDSLNANIHPYSLIYNVSLKKLRIFDGYYWKDAFEEIEIKVDEKSNISLKKDYINNKIFLDLKPTGITPGIYNDFEIDKFGRILKANNDITKIIEKIVTPYGISFEEANEDW